MARPARRVPKFGAFLRETRGNRSRLSVVNQVRPFGIRFDPSALAKYEDEGRVPPADVLRGAAIAYSMPVSELFDRLLAELGAEPIDWQKDIRGGWSQPDESLGTAGALEASAGIPNEIDHIPSAAPVHSPLGSIDSEPGGVSHVVAGETDSSRRGQPTVDYSRWSREDIGGLLIERGAELQMLGEALFGRKNPVARAEEPSGLRSGKETG